MVTRDEQIARVCAELDEVMSAIAFSDMELCELTALLMLLRPVYDRVTAPEASPRDPGLFPAAGKKPRPPDGEVFL